MWTQQLKEQARQLSDKKIDSFLSLQERFYKN